MNSKLHRNDPASRSVTLACAVLAMVIALTSACAMRQVKPLTEEDASYGSISLRYDYARALRDRDRAALLALYHPGDQQGEALPWQPPATTEENGIRLQRDDNRTVPVGQVPAFVDYLVGAYNEVTRAQVWFHEFEPLDPDHLSIKVWVEVNGNSAEGRRAHRGMWHWDVAREGSDAPWLIHGQQLVHWDETFAAVPFFEEAAAGAGIDLVHEQGLKEDAKGGADLDHDVFVPEIHAGSGVALADMDRDGDLDACFGSGGRNRLYRNLGHGRFEDITESSGTGYEGNTRGLVFTDLTGDGLPDIYLANANSLNVFYRNRGDGSFEDLSEQSGARGLDTVNTSVVAADVDLDGDLDLLVTAYRPPENFFANLFATNGARNLLLMNDGSGHFTEEGEQRGLPETAWSQAAAFGDADDDGDPDLFVANDFAWDHYYINDGTGHFTQAAADSGITRRGFSMSASWGDVDNDGDQDIYVSKMTSGTTWMFDDKRFPMKGIQRLVRKKVISDLMDETAGNSLFENQGDGTFREISVETGTWMAHWSWGSDFWDFDRDGDLDIYCAMGFWSGESSEDT